MSAPDRSAATEPEETLQWIKDWREGMFSSTSRDAAGWPIETYGLVESYEKLAAAYALTRDALIRIGGLDARGFEGYHNVGDKWDSSTCPGCWAWWGLFGTVKPGQDQLDGLRAVEGIKGHVAD